MVQQSTVVVSGYVLAEDGQLPLRGCNVEIVGQQWWATTNDSGFFEMDLRPGQYTLIFNYLGYSERREDVTVVPGKNIRMTVVLEDTLIMSETNLVIDEREFRPTIQTLEQVDIKRMPTVYNDVLRSIKILPGVTSNNELSSSYNVRGGNLHENLIYLNGYEIYRPFLLRQGVEENQSVVNPDLVTDIVFDGGAFPANKGDKLASALDVNYSGSDESGSEGILRAGLMNTGIAWRKNFGDWQWAMGARYANPALFVNQLQTGGDYQPRFADAQMLLGYSNDKNDVELFLLEATNRFDLTPDRWQGNYQSARLVVRQVEIDYEGQQEYSFRNGLSGLRYRRHFSPTAQFEVSLARLRTEENENIDLAGDVWFVEEPIQRPGERVFLKSRTEFANNRLALEQDEIQLHYIQQLGVSGERGQTNEIELGLVGRRLNVESRLDEAISEVGEQRSVETPIRVQQTQSTEFVYWSGFAQYSWHTSNWAFNAGLRGAWYEFNDESFLSPRARISWRPNDKNRLSLSYGIYYQPPFIYELRDKDFAAASQLKSQRARHYIFSWEREYNNGHTLQIDVFHKNLDRLIPYFVDELRLDYEDENSHKGYANGIDFLLKGEFVKGVNSWVSYSYLTTKERRADESTTYKRRLLDQSHTLRIFLQDQTVQLPNLQGHLRLLFGSGFRYFPREIVADPTTGNQLLAVNFERTERFNLYARADLGLTYRIGLDPSRHILLTAEVLNIFNNVNAASYDWFQISPQARIPVRIPQVFTNRFLNISAELNF